MEVLIWVALISLTSLKCSTVWTCKTNFTLEQERIYTIYMLGGLGIIWRCISMSLQETCKLVASKSRQHPTCSWSIPPVVPGQVESKNPWCFERGAKDKRCELAKDNYGQLIPPQRPQPSKSPNQWVSLNTGTINARCVKNKGLARFNSV